MEMPRITIQTVSEYLKNLHEKRVRIISMTTKGAEEAGAGLKGFGYGSPLFIEYEVSGEIKKVVLETMAPSTFGHDHFSDRAQTILWEHSCFNTLPRHVRSIDAGAVLEGGDMISTGNAEEFFILTEFVEGEGYFKDLMRISRTGGATAGDMDRVSALSDYLVEIHAIKTRAPHLYTRRIRELIGHGECIMGLIDNYPERFGFIDRRLLKKIELLCVEWRWKIKGLSHRLSQVHGDFHPWNILFREGADFTVLDRSRGEWGEPADDVCSITMNYIFFFFLSTGRAKEAFVRMFSLFWKNYLSKTRDEEILCVTAPFYAWRGLVVASPIWYPDIPDEVRRAVFGFILNILQSERFDPAQLERYIP